MHVTTETSHPAHVCEVDGTGLTGDDRRVLEAICRIGGEPSTRDVADEADLRDRQQAHRCLGRLREAGVVECREADVELTGVAQSPRLWSVTDRGVDSGCVERVRAGEGAILERGGGVRMTVYRNDNRVELIAADFAQTPPTLEWAYRSDDLKADGGRDADGTSPGGRTRDTQTDSLCRFTADGGYRELMRAVQQLPPSRVRGQRVAGGEPVDGG